MSPGIVPFEALSAVQQEAAAIILVDALQHAPSAWRDQSAAQAEVASFLDDPERAAIALLEEHRLIGWVGRISCYDGKAWELHPLVVDPSLQRRGHGRRLVAALEELARAAGVLTLFLGADDDFGGTSLFGADLYPDVLRRLADLEVTASHPVAFYRKLGFSLVGVLPDVNGPGRPDILMAKSMSRQG